MKMLLHTFVFLLTIYTFVLSILYLFQDKFIFFPQPTAPGNRSRYAAHEIRLSHDKVTLTGWFVNRGIDAEDPLIVYYGGNAEDVSMNFSDLHRFNTGSFLFMNYRGYGDSGGKPSEQSLFDDALFVFDHILETFAIDPDHVVLMGRSLGSGVAVHVAAKRKAGAVILVTPYDSLVAVAQNHYPVFPVGLLLRHRFDSLSVAPGISAPALFLTAEKDQVVPSGLCRRLVSQWKGRVTEITVEGVDHNSIETAPVYWEAINDFLSP